MKTYPRGLVGRATARSWFDVRVTPGSGDLEELLAHGVDHRFHAGVQLQLLEDVPNVVLDSVLADEQLLGDVAVVETLRDEAQDLHLPVREPRRGQLLALVAALDH